MKACILASPAPVESSPLRIVELPKPKPAAGQVLVRVHACAVCRTDLHVVEGELAPRKSPIVPGHQVVGVVEENGPHASRFQPGARVGIPWLHQTCGACEYCRSARENLCERAVFTGWMVDGGYAEYVVAPEDFVYPLPDGLQRPACGAAAVRRNYRLPHLAQPIESGRRTVFFATHSRGASHLHVQPPELRAAGCFVLAQLLGSRCDLGPRVFYRSPGNFRIVTQPADAFDDRRLDCWFPDRLRLARVPAPLLGVVADVVSVRLRSAHRVSVDHRRVAGNAEHQPVEQSTILVPGAIPAGCSVAAEKLMNLFLFASQG